MVIVVNGVPINTVIISVKSQISQNVRQNGNGHYERSSRKKI